MYVATPGTNRNDSLTRSDAAATTNVQSILAAGTNQGWQVSRCMPVDLRVAYTFLGAVKQPLTQLCVQSYAQDWNDYISGKGGVIRPCGNAYTRAQDTAIRITALVLLHCATASCAA